MAELTLMTKHLERIATALEKLAGITPEPRGPSLSSCFMCGSLQCECSGGPYPSPSHGPTPHPGVEPRGLRPFAICKVCGAELGDPLEAMDHYYLCSSKMPVSRTRSVPSQFLANDDEDFEYGPGPEGKS